MLFGFLKKIFVRDKQEICQERNLSDNDKNENFLNNALPATYELKSGTNEIYVNSHLINVNASIPENKSIRLEVKDGEICIYNNGGYCVEFDTDEKLKIVLMENTNKSFKLKGGRGDDTILIKEGVVLNEVYGGEGNDTIIHDGIAYYIYGGDGDDTIINNGIVNTIYGEDGNDTVVNNAIVGKYIDVGSGDDEVINNAEVGRYISGGDGNDKLVNKGNIAWSSTNGFENLTGEINGILYLNGEKYSGIYENGLMYQDGRLFTGILSADNEYYENGKKVEKN